MGRKTVDVLDVRIDRDRYAHNANVLLARSQQRADGAWSLETDKADGIVRARQPVAQMMHDTAATRHAARSDDDCAGSDVVERDRTGRIGDAGDVLCANAGGIGTKP